MVLPDWDSGPKRPPRIQITHSSPPGGAPRFALAPPLKRLGAVIIDVTLVLTPSYVLVTAPLKRRMTAAMLVGTETSVALYAGAMALTAVVLCVTYQTICHHRFGRTLGKRAFGLKVVSAFGEPSTWGAQLARASAFVASALCLGLPYLSVWAAPRRRPPHDRVGDTVVVTTGSDGVGAPGPTARRLVRTIYAAAGTCAVLMMIFGLREWTATGLLQERLLDSAARGGAECEVISRAVDPDDADEHARLKQALTFYAAGLADRSCLEMEVDRESTAQTAIAPVTYLAQAFVNADDADVSNAYLDRVCADAKGSVECAMSQVVSAWSDADWPAVGRALASVPVGSGYLDVWGVRHFARQAEYASALTSLDALIGRPELASFTLVQRVKAYYGAYRPAEGRAAYQQAVTTLDDDEARDLSAWTCVQDLADGCGALEAPACAGVVNAAADAEDDGDAKSSPIERLVTTRALECRSPAKVDYDKIANRFEVTDTAWRTLFEGGRAARDDDRTAAARAFNEVIADESAPALLRTEAARRLADVASPRQMRELVSTWEKITARDSWVHAGNLIFDRLAARGDVELALNVADRLTADHALSPPGRLTRAALGAGGDYDGDDADDEPPTLRAPAAAADAE